jgi:hypothetical protein
MAKRIYETGYIELMDGTLVELGPLKIKFYVQFMSYFQLIKYSRGDNEAISVLAECATICMKQHYPIIQKREDLEEIVDLPTVYKILELCAGIKIDPNKEENIEDQAKENVEKQGSWEDFNLVDLEAEAFLAGSWKNFEELEASITMPELIKIIETRREFENNQRKFDAALQGVDLDKEEGKSSNAWEEMKARVFSGGKTDNPNDILALQGQNAVKAGFGIGMGLSYQKIERKKD